MHTHAGLAQLASVWQPSEARRRGEERRGERAPTAAARDFLPPLVLREEPASKDRTKATAVTGQRQCLALPVSRGGVVHIPDAVPAMSLTPFVRWAYSAGGFLKIS